MITSVVIERLARKYGMTDYEVNGFDLKLPMRTNANAPLVRAHMVPKNGILLITRLDLTLSMSNTGNPAPIGAVSISSAHGSADYLPEQFVPTYKEKFENQAPDDVVLRQYCLDMCLAARGETRFVVNCVFDISFRNPKLWAKGYLITQP